MISQIKKIFKQNRDVYGLLSSFLIIILCIEIYRNYSLKKTENTFAVYNGCKGGVGNANKFFIYFNRQEKRKIEVSVSTHLEQVLNIGDTVKIKYSLSDPEIIEVIGRKR